ncbi:MAG: AAA family ATPase [Tunicatimonas sp.]
MEKLPIGIQDFGKLRERGFVYVDKTELIYQLTQGGGYYFLSRPRRFGKSLLVSTLAELFRGHRTLFEGLWIHDRWDWSQTYAVLDFRFNNASYKISGLEAFLKNELNYQAEAFQITLREAPYPNQFRELVTKLSQQHGRVVILIDEYDKPILDYLDDIKQAKANREVLKNFFSVLKSLDPHLRLVLLTGVSKFTGSPAGSVSIFSDLNNLKDLTLHWQYSALLGYTQDELEHYFADRIDQFAPDFGGRAALLAQIKQWYNGYTWDAKRYLYNPFSILSFFDQGRFQNFWFETGTPMFLVKLLERERQYDLTEIRVDEAVFSSFELDHIDPNALLFQTGYITIASADDKPIYTLSYPNREVRDSLLRYLLAEYTQSYASEVPVRAQQMKQALEQEDLAGFVQALNSLFASIPYQIFIADREAYCQSVTFLALSLVGTFVQVEVSQAKGRPDAVVHTPDIIYVLEFKLDSSAQTALEQIKERGYAQPYVGGGKTVRAVGLNFNAQLKALDQWQQEAIQ